jgi:hypothetical protein
LNARCIGSSLGLVKQTRLVASEGVGPQTEGVKPGEHPEFFRFPAPEGASRESTIRLDGEGRFFHEGALVEHPRLAAAMSTWVRRHPDNGRFILSNGYDWTYFTVEDAPFFVRHVDPQGWLELSDGTREEWDPERSFVGEAGAVYAEVKAKADGGPFLAKFTRHAQASLEPLLVQVGGEPGVNLSGRIVRIGKRSDVGGR